MLGSLTALAVAYFSMSANAQIIPDNIVSTSLSGALSAAKYTNVGGSGTYNQVTGMVAGTWPSCDVNPSCITAPKTVSGPLAPFDEDMTFNFRGPMKLYNIAVYQPTNTTAATWKRVSNWAQNQAPDNMVFMNNLGGGKSGEWTSEYPVMLMTHTWMLTDDIFCQCVVETVNRTPTVTGPTQSRHPTSSSTLVLCKLAKRLQVEFWLLCHS